VRDNDGFRMLVDDGQPQVGTQVLGLELESVPILSDLDSSARQMDSDLTLNMQDSDSNLQDSDGLGNICI